MKVFLFVFQEWEDGKVNVAALTEGGELLGTEIFDDKSALAGIIDKYAEMAEGMSYWMPSLVLPAPDKAGDLAPEIVWIDNPMADQALGAAVAQFAAKQGVRWDQFEPDATFDNLTKRLKQVAAREKQRRKAALLNAKLCYVKGAFAWFTTGEITDMWANHWDHAPYEHNAEPPYEWREGDRRPRFEIVKVAFDCDLLQPNGSHLNSPYSVQQINQGAIPWLRSWEVEDPAVKVYGGTDLASFIRVIGEQFSEVFMPYDPADFDAPVLSGE